MAFCGVRLEISTHAPVKERRVWTSDEPQVFEFQLTLL